MLTLRDWKPYKTNKGGGASAFAIAARSSTIRRFYPTPSSAHKGARPPVARGAGK